MADQYRTLKDGAPESVLRLPPPNSCESTEAGEVLTSSDKNCPGSVGNRAHSSENLSQDNLSEDAPMDKDVWLHFYHCDVYTGFLNTLCLNTVDLPICHVGVEVFGEEWAFQYFEDAWDEPAISGVVRCYPKSMADFEYQYSQNLGPTPLSVDEVDQILMNNHYDWPACSYHLTRRNCVTFANQLVKQLQPRDSIPEKYLWIDASTRSHPNTDAVVDYGWNWAKWFMLRKHSQVNASPGAGAGCFERTCGGRCSVMGVDDKETAINLDGVDNGYGWSTEKPGVAS